MAFELPEPNDDGLYMDQVGPWSADKHHFLRRYIDAFTTSMKAKGWSGLHYIDLFAGPGVLRIKEKGLDWGSPLIAAQVPNRFAKLHLCDLGSAQFNALSERIRRYPQPSPPQLINADANTAIKEITPQIPPGALSLAFLDPHGLHLHYSTLRVLAEKRVDLIIFFPDHLDMVRNWKIYEEQEDSNLDRVFGTSAWRSELQTAPSDRKAEVLQLIYTRQLKALGYSHFADERISRTDGVRLYKLIFCSKDPAGEKIWNGIAKKKRDGQYGLFN